MSNLYNKIKQKQNISYYMIYLSTILKYRESIGFIYIVCNKTQFCVLADLFRIMLDGIIQLRVHKILRIYICVKSNLLTETA